MHLRQGATLNRVSFRKKATSKKRHRKHFAPSGEASRLHSAIIKAREMKAILRRGDADDLAQATLLQGIISGDVISASIITRQRLQRENLRLRERLAVQKLRESRAQERLLQLTADKAEQQINHAEIVSRVREIYGLQPFANPQLPASTEIIQENPDTLPQDTSVESS